MKYDLVLKNATVVTSSGSIQADLAVYSGKIVEIGSVHADGATERDCTGLFVLPGLIDMHVHFRDPGATHKENFSTGTAAAAAGGVTTVIDMPNTEPAVTTVEILEQKRALVAAKSLVNFGLYFGATDSNIEEVKLATHIGGVKICMSKTTGSLYVSDDDVLEKLFALDKFFIIHAEDMAMIDENEKRYARASDPRDHSIIRSRNAAFAATKKVIHLARKYNTRVHITHMSTAAEVEELTKCKGETVTADCTPHHLFLDENAYETLGNFAKMNPPLRKEEDCQALWRGLSDGTIAAVATDHAPHTKEEKKQSFMQAPSGVPGIETMLPLLLDAVNHGQLTLPRVATLTSKAPAHILKIPQKGTLQVGYDADIVVVDMNQIAIVGQRGFYTKCGWSPFEGMQLQGWPVMTFVGGRLVFDNGRIDESIRGKDVF